MAHKNKRFSPTYTVEQSQRNAVIVRCPLSRSANWSQWFLLTSDRHWDNPASDWSLQREHLEEARERGAGVIDNGDFFCAMQGKFDKRADKSAVRPEHQNDHYLDSLVSTATDFFEPFAQQFILIGSGNHEESIVKRHETNLIERLCGALYDRTGHRVVHGGFGGWVRFVFIDPTNRKKSFGINLHYDHGYGGGGPVTKGVIQNNRRGVYLPDAHLVVSGHIHERSTQDVQRLRFTDAGRSYHDTQTHVILPSYKEEYGDGASGWHARRGAPPKPVGGAWLRFKWCRRQERVVWEVTWA